VKVRPAARLVAVLGAVGVGWLLLEARPREVVLVYDLSRDPAATALEVEIRRGGEVVRHARMAVRTAEQARHPVRLRDGTYALAWRVERPGGARTGEREIEVQGEGTIVLPLGP
jgi:hypothetical protein